MHSLPYLLSNDFLLSSSHFLTKASISSPWMLVEMATLLTDSFIASVSPEQSSLSSVGKQKILFLGDFYFLGLVIWVERIGKLSVGYSFGQSFWPLDKTKCVLQTRVDVLNWHIDLFFQSCVPTTSAVFYCDVVNGEMKHLYHAWNSLVNNKTNPWQCLNITTTKTTWKHCQLQLYKRQYKKT